MSSFVASALVLLLFLAGLAIIAVAARRPGAARLATALGMLLFVGLSFHYFGLGFGRPSAANVPAPGGAAVPLAQCNRAIEVSEQAGIIISRSNPTRIPVRRARWEQLPEQAQTVLRRCLGAAAGLDGEAEVVPQ